MDIEDRFDAVSDNYLKFDRVEDKRSQRPDLHAFLLLDDLFPHLGCNIVSAANHDEIWLDVNKEQLEKLTDEQILELTQCGIRLDGGDCLSMFTDVARTLPVCDPRWKIQ